MRRILADGASLASLDMQVPERIEVEGKRQVELTWLDGHRQVLSARELRAACPCAACREPDGARRTALVLGGPVPVEIDGAELVGDYAITFTFSPDAHRTGIFSWDYLRELSPEPPLPDA